MQGLVKSMSFSGEEKVNIYFHPYIGLTSVTKVSNEHTH